jgi:hypothetical protein
MNGGSKVRQSVGILIKEGENEIGKWKWNADTGVVI